LVDGSKQTVAEQLERIGPFQFLSGQGDGGWTISTVAGTAQRRPPLPGFHGSILNEDEAQIENLRQGGRRGPYGYQPGRELMADLTQLRAEIDEGLRTRRFLDYWESSEWASEATPVVDAIRDALAASPSAELLGLIERAVGHVIKVILRADDSNGEIGGLAAELLESHGLACDAGVADPVKLARWMVRFTVDDQDFFVLDPKRYADALGETGLAVYRKEIDRRRREGEQPFALRYVDERLAVLDGDVDKIIRLLGGNLTSPYQFIQVTEAMVELGRDDDALAWAQRGIAETGGWQVAQLYDLAAGVYVRRGALGEVVALRWDQHRRMTSSTTYALLREAAEATGGWESERSSARSVLEAKDLGGLVDALLADGEPEAAWRVADDQPDWDPGRRRWKRLAESRESSHPADAMAVYFKLADFELETTGRSSYTRAAALLKKARRAADAAGRRGEFSEHLVALREQFRKRPALLEILDRSALR
jgi:uncharacterized Zn finger protein